MQLKGHKSDVTCLCFTPISEQIITASRDGSIRAWNINGDIDGIAWPPWTIPNAGVDKKVKLWSAPEQLTVDSACAMLLLIGEDAYNAGLDPDEPFFTGYDRSTRLSRMGIGPKLALLLKAPCTNHVYYETNQIKIIDNIMVQHAVQSFVVK